MKILVVSNYRGLHTCRPEAEIFIGLKKMGFDITIMTYSDSVYIDRFKQNGIKVIPNHPTKRYDTKFIELLREELETGSYDILQLFNNKAITNGLKSAKNLDVKVVIYRGTSLNMSWLNPLNYFKFFHSRVDYAICNSDESRNKFLNVPFYKKEKAITIFKGHETKWYDDIVPYDIRQELGISKDDLLLVIVANNRKVKAIPDLMKAMKYIPKESEISLVVIGSNMETPEIKKLSKASGNEEKIHFLGFRNDSLDIVAACDIFVLPSTGGEALTKSVIEAMSLGVVPLISDIPGNTPLVDHGINGFKFQKSNPKNLAEKIIYAYQNRQIIAELSRKAKLKIDSDISSKESVRQYSQLYESIVN